MITIALRARSLIRSVLILLLVPGLTIPAFGQISAQAYSQANVDEVIATLKSSHRIRTDAADQKFWINEPMWNAWSTDQKQIVALTCSAYRKYHKGRSKVSITIIGDSSGKVLATVGNDAKVVLQGDASGPSSPSAAPQPSAAGSVTIQGVTTSVSEVESMITALKAAGMITRISRNNNEVQIDRRMWESVSLDVKKGMTITCAQYFKAHGESSLATLVDNRTGKVLASFGAWAGVEIHGE